jgi:DNA repair protein RadC
MEKTLQNQLYDISEVQLVYRRCSNPKVDIVVIHSETAHLIFKEAWDENKIDMVEEFKILLLRQNNACIGVSHISTGGISSCIADPRIIFATALKANATSIILAHNHPSGNTTPSFHDKELTEKVAQAGKFLDIKVLDHLIITSCGYSSMAEDGYMPS